jgi:hypothetical protein
MMSTDQAARKMVDLAKMTDLSWFVVIDVDNVNLDDLLDAKVPGSIVRCFGPPDESIKVFVRPDSPELGCIAGWVSEDES